MRSKNWLFTINNPGNEDMPDNWEYKYLCYQRECGANGTVHIQGYVIWNNRRTLNSCRAINARAHWEIRRGTHDQAVEYCTKQDTRVEGTEPFISGTPPSPGARSDLEDIKEMVDSGESMQEVSTKHFGSYIRYYKGIHQYALLHRAQRSWKTEVVVLYGPPGTGKSRRCLESYPDAYWKPHGKWFDGYDGHEDVVIDDFYGWLPYSQLLNILDRYPLNVETKGGTTGFIAKHLVLTSNQHPQEWYRNHPYGALERRIDLLVEMMEDGHVVHLNRLTAQEQPAPIAGASPTVPAQQ